MHESEKWKWSRSVVSDSSRPHGLQPTRLLHPWDFPGKSTGVGCHCLLHQFYNLLEILCHKECILHISIQLIIIEEKNSLYNWSYTCANSPSFLPECLNCLSIQFTIVTNIKQRFLLCDKHRDGVEGLVAGRQYRNVAFLSGPSNLVGKHDGEGSLETLASG